MGFRKILCPVDFSSGSDQALHAAARLSVTTHAELILAHAWHLPPSAAPVEYPLAPDVIQMMVDDEERGLAEAASEAKRIGATNVSTRFLNGVPWDRIVELALVETDVDLIAMGTHGRTGLSRLLLGSVAEKVVRHASCSVLVTRPRGEPGSYKNVLCPVDFSTSSRVALQHAGEIAALSGGVVTLLHAIELPVAYQGKAPADFMTDLDRLATQQLDRWATELAATWNVPVKKLLRIGNPSGQVLSVLGDEPSYDLAVVGSHGRTGIRRVLIGSVAEKIVRHAPCSVIVARDRGGEARS